MTKKEYIRNLLLRGKRLGYMNNNGYIEYDYHPGTGVRRIYTMFTMKGTKVYYSNVTWETVFRNHKKFEYIDLNWIIE